MNQDNHQNYHYTSSQYAPYQQQQASFDQDSAVSRVLKSPILAIGALMLVGAAFASAIIVSYNGREDGDAVVPVVQAQNEPFKVAPKDAGGLDVPFQDSTVFESLAGANIQEAAPVENLLSGDDEIARLDALTAEAERLIKESEAARRAAQTRNVETAALIEQATGVSAPVARVSGTALNATEPASGGADVSSIPSENLLQKIEAGSQPGELYNIIEAGSSVSEVAAADADADAASDALAVASSQEAPQDPVVRQVVASAKPAPPKATQSAAAREVAAIAPAAGFVLSSGSHYVQLGSVKSQAGASSEWGKFKKKYSAELSEAKYRVQRADLGGRGVFYRIQAGPMSGESAKEVCNSIKAQTPGGCLVVK